MSLFGLKTVRFYVSNIVPHPYQMKLSESSGAVLKSCGNPPDNPFRIGGRNRGRVFLVFPLSFAIPDNMRSPHGGEGSGFGFHAPGFKMLRKE
jgi:hypothetical protein